MNGFWIDGTFRPADAVHLGVAISLRGGGLIAPAVHNADTKNLDELMAGMRELVARARAGRLRASEMSDPTITVTNLGDRGIELVHGAIYPPQVALVGFGAVRERPWAEDGMLGVRPIVTATLAAGPSRIRRARWRSPPHPDRSPTTETGGTVTEPVIGRESGGTLESSAVAGPSIDSIGASSTAPSDLRRGIGRGATGRSPAGCGRTVRRPRGRSSSRTRSTANVGGRRDPRPWGRRPPGSQRNASSANAAAPSPHAASTPKSPKWTARLPVIGLNADSRPSANGRSGKNDAIRG